MNPPAKRYQVPIVCYPPPPVLAPPPPPIVTSSAAILAQSAPVITPEIYVVDTSVFTNPQYYKDMGRSPLEALQRILDQHPIYMTPGCVNEMQSFFDVKKVRPSLQPRLHIKAPNTGVMVVPAVVMHEMVHEFRQRGDKALKLATDLLKETYNVVPEPRKRVKGEADPIHPYINRLRDGMRHHMRTNFVDSTQDLDTLLLALELRARLVTGDLGMRKWADKLGIEWMEPSVLLNV